MVVAIVVAVVVEVVRVVNVNVNVKINVKKKNVAIFAAMSVTDVTIDVAESATVVV